LFLLTGIRYGLAELRAVAGRIQTLTKLINLREGATRADDILPKRLLSESINEGKSLITREELDLMLDDYYLLRGWNEKGIPPYGNY